MSSVIMILTLIAILIFIGFDYGRLLLEKRRLEEESISYTPVRNIMVIAGKEDNAYMRELVSMCMQAHSQADIATRSVVSTADTDKVYFENGDELLIFDYTKLAQIGPLSKEDKNGYANKLFFDYKLPIGAERAVIEQLGLVDYMINIGICRGGNNGGK